MHREHTSTTNAEMCLRSQPAPQTMPCRSYSQSSANNMIGSMEHSSARTGYIGAAHQGRRNGGYIGIYTPKSVYLKFLCGCFVSLTQDKFDIVQFIPTQIKFLATPLLRIGPN